MENKYYYKDGSVLDYRAYDKQLHRLDGPAIEFAYGDKFWYIDGKRLTEEDFDNHPKRVSSSPADQLQQCRDHLRQINVGNFDTLHDIPKDMLITIIKTILIIYERHNNHLRS